MPPPAPSVHRPGLPADLDRIVLKALAKNLDDRYQNWEEFSANLAVTDKNLALPANSISDTEKFGAIKAVPFFREFAHLDVWEMVRIADFRRLGPRETVVREGEACDSFFPDRRRWSTGNQRRPRACGTRQRRLLRRNPLLRRQGKTHQLRGLDHAADHHRSQRDGAAAIERRVPEAVQPRVRAHSPGPCGTTVEGQCAPGRSRKE
jgi:hypothetical protein